MHNENQSPFSAPFSIRLLNSSHVISTLSSNLYSKFYIFFHTHSKLSCVTMVDRLGHMDMLLELQGELFEHMLKEVVSFVVLLWGFIQLKVIDLTDIFTGS